MIVTFGDAIVDLFACPVGSDVASAEQFVPRQGGAPANVAVVAARMGAAVRFVGAVGRDAHGDRLIRELRDAGVDTRGVVVVPQRTGVTFVRVGKDGTRSFLFYRQGGADLSLAPEHLDALELHPLDGATWLQVMSSALVVEPMASASRRMLAWAEQREVPLSLDLNVRAHLWSDPSRMRDECRRLVAASTIVKASEEDLDALGVSVSIEGLGSLMARTDAVAILTLAERGAVARIGGVEIRVPADDVNVVDTTGAGDAFVGTMLAGIVARGMRPGDREWRDGSVWESILRTACHEGSRAVTALGATAAHRGGDARPLQSA
jgi:sugar/nucleoside kinase (ribokinase family)